MDPKFLKCIYTAEAIYLKNDEAETLFKILEEMPNIISSNSHEAKELFQNTSLEKFINKNDKDKRGYNALVYAVNNDSYEVAKLLLEKGIKVKSEDRIMDMTKSQKMRDLLRDYGIKW